MLNGQILDGRHRARACRELGIDYPIQDISGDPVAIVAGLNLHRRHLAPDQVVAIAELLKVAMEVNGKPEHHVMPEISRRVGKASVEVAQRLGVSPATVERVQQVKREAPENLPAIAAGHVKATAVLTALKAGPNEEGHDDEVADEVQDIVRQIRSALVDVQAARRGLKRTGEWPHSCDELGRAIQLLNSAVKEITA